MIIDKNTHIQDFKLFEEQDGHLIPVVYTGSEGADYQEWSTFAPGQNVHQIVLTDGAIWTEEVGFRTGDDRAERRSTVAHNFPHLAELMGVQIDPVLAQGLAKTREAKALSAPDLTAPTKAAKQKRLAAARKKTQ